MGVIVPLHAIEPQRIHAYGARSPDAAQFKTEPRRSVPLNGPLDCLAGRALAAHFHAWRGNAGKRYVCSVFPVKGEERLGGLPEFDAAVALAVRINADGQRKRIAMFELSWCDGQFAGDRTCVDAALRAGALEWHIHLLVESPRARQAMIDDLKDQD